MTSNEIIGIIVDTISSPNTYDWRKEDEALEAAFDDAYRVLNPPAKRANQLRAFMESGKGRAAFKRTSPVQAWAAEQEDFVQTAAEKAFGKKTLAGLRELQEELQSEDYADTIIRDALDNTKEAEERLIERIADADRRDNKLFRSRILGAAENGDSQELERIKNSIITSETLSGKNREALLTGIESAIQEVKEKGRLERI